MPYRRIILALPLLLLATPTDALEGCFCAKDNPENRKCGQIEWFDPSDAVTLREFIGEKPSGAKILGAPITLLFLNFTECPRRSQPIEAQKTQPSLAPVQPPSPPPATPSPTPIDRDESFGIAGSNTIGEVLMPTLIKGYASRNDFKLDGENCNGSFLLQKKQLVSRTVTIRCEAKGSATGIPALLRKEADIAMLSRRMTDDEQADMAAAGFPRMTYIPHETVLALDGIRIIVSPQNKVSALSASQIARIFSGEITDWSRVGGEPGPIHVYVRDSGSGTRETFEHLVMEPNGKQIMARPQQMFESSGELSASVQHDPQGIGFVGFAYPGGSKSLGIREPCGIRHEPSPFTVKTEDYPLSRRLFLYRSQLTSLHSQELVSYAISEEAQPLIEKAGYVNQLIDAWELATTQDRIADYVAEPTQEPELDIDRRALSRLAEDVKGASRLSISFHFRFASFDLDTKALDDVLRLGRYLQRRSSERVTMLLLGFADAVGSFEANRMLAERRALAVRDALRRTGATSTSP
jgi:phosphate transport system substrate-binding protein